MDSVALEEAVSRALEYARHLGASQAEAGARLTEGLEVKVRLAEVDTLVHRRDRELSVTVYLGQCKGRASTADLRVDAVRSTVERACALARFTAPDPCAGLLEPKLLAWTVPDLDLDHPSSLEPEEAIETARRCEQAGLALDGRVTHSEGASVSHLRQSVVVGNSHGFLAGYSGTTHTIGCRLIAKRDGQMQRGSWFTTARDASELESAESVGVTAARRAAERLGARKLSTRLAPVLFTPQMARGLFGHFVAAIQGTGQYRKSSFLLDAAGRQVFPTFVSMRERPHLPKGLASAPFDAEGAATHDRELVENGVLRSYLLSGYSARRLGVETTGNAGGLHNLLVEAADGSASGLRGWESLLTEMGSGLWVTDLMGQGVNGVTGDYSRGASGFWVEGGAVAHPVHEVTIAHNLRHLYRGIAALGDDVDVRGAIRCGSVLVGEMTVAGE